MSSLIRSHLRVVAIRIAALACLGLFVAPGVALASSPDPSVGTLSSQWGNDNNYLVIPGGSADQVDSTLSGATLTSGNGLLPVSAPEVYLDPYRSG